ncbi:hypothetical protein AWU65_20475 [Paenibacillus glucanolyticus]|uniref:Uncharacterized protein n=1 Tax=Paenibacillus glucanolyticus TaxID=59843 RepID=A0A163LHK5_9BACL|nr:hypothetical protein [Paenibacillus glucanolyticus]KZS48134.1 hypothetical protein AWU65_20475 [Paenibacillus glucanolyticus]
MRMAEAITSEDIFYVKHAVILPLVITAFERDCRYLGSNLKTPGPYVDTIKLAIDRAWVDLRKIKKHLWKKGLKVYEENHTKQGIKAKFKCRGYTSELDLHWEFITAEASILMRKYLGLDVTIYEDPTIPEHLRERY